jgi:hypothetical protein
VPYAPLAFSRWLKQRGVALRSITSDHLPRYLRYRARQVRPNRDDVAALMHLLNVIRAWLGHASLETTNRYAEINLPMKREALQICQPPVAAASGALPEDLFGETMQSYSIGSSRFKYYVSKFTCSTQQKGHRPRSRPHNVAGYITSILFRGTKSMSTFCGTPPKNSKAF